MTAPLRGTTAVVTGASRGIGEAIARALAAAGARVALLARDRSRLDAVASDLAGAVPIACDLANATDAERGLKRVRASLGVPHIVVNNAGAFALGAIGALPLGEMEQMLDVNLRAPYRVLHGFLPAMRELGRGHLVTVGSVADRAPIPENAVYAATKFGVRAMHEVLLAEIRGTGLRASLVSPSAVDTELWDAIAPETRPGFPRRDRMLRAEDVADAVLWAVTRPAHVNVEEIRVGSAQ